MTTLILRYPEPRHRLGAPRRLVVLLRTKDGKESALETLEVGAKGSTLEDVIKSEIRRGHRRFILDLIHEKQLDSSDLAQLIEAFKRAEESGGELVIADANAKIREILRITKLDEVVGLFDSVASAALHLEKTG